MYFNHKQAVLIAALNFLILLAPLSRKHFTKTYL
jgi:hypothetical protein